MALLVQPWRAYYCPICQHRKPAPGPKYVVIVCNDAFPMGFLINSRITPFIAKSPDLLAGQVTILVAEHPFLQWDSHVDCNDLYPFDEKDLTDDRGPISDNAKTRIKETVAKSRVLTRDEKKMILGR